MSVEFPRTRALIEEYGIEPRLVSVAGIDVNGYDEYSRDEAEKYRYADGERIVIRREWPSLAAGIAIVDTFIQEGGWKK